MNEDCNGTLILVVRIGVETDVDAGSDKMAGWNHDVLPGLIRASARPSEKVSARSEDKCDGSIKSTLEFLSQL